MPAITLERTEEKPKTKRVRKSPLKPALVSLPVGAKVTYDSGGAVIKGRVTKRKCSKCGQQSIIVGPVVGRENKMPTQCCLNHCGKSVGDALNGSAFLGGKA